MEQNLATMASACHNLHVNLRPHFKNHCVLALAARQIKAGAIGITVARVRHADKLLRSGIRSILVANEIVSLSELREIQDLMATGEVILAVDDLRVIADMGRLAREAGKPFHVVIEVDLGLNRCGVSPENSVDLARLALREGLLLRGLMGYEGHLQKLAASAESRQKKVAATRLLASARDRWERSGIDVEIVTTAGTGTFEVAAENPAVTEVQPGTYLLMETLYSPYAPQFRLSLSVLSTIISRANTTCCVLDAGVKAISGERGLPALRNPAGLLLTALHAEHAIVKIDDPSAAIEVGSKIEIPVAYSDATMHLHRRMYGVRDGFVEEVFEIED